MFGLFNVKKEPATPAEEKLDMIKNLLFPQLELREKYDEESDQIIKYHIDYAVDSNLESVLSDLEDGFNDPACHRTINNTIKTLNEVRKLLEAYWSIETDAKYIIVDTKKEENDVDFAEQGLTSPNFAAIMQREQEFPKREYCGWNGSNCFKMEKCMTKTAIEKVRTVLVDKGQSLTSKQIATRFGVANPRDIIYRLRNDGVKVVRKTFTAKNGKTTSKYTVA